MYDDGIGADEEEEARLERARHLYARRASQRAIRHQTAALRAFRAQQGASSLPLCQPPRTTEPSTESKLWIEHEIRWKDFLRNPPSPVTTQTIPWPPAVLGMLDGMRRAAETQGQACDSQAKASPELDTLKHWIRTATLRWHPDKFMANFGSRLQPDDRQAIVQRVHEIWHCLQQEMSMLAASMSCRS